MALFNSRVFNSVARRSFLLDHGVAMGPITAGSKNPEEKIGDNQQQVNQKYDDMFGKVQTPTKKKKADKVDCDDKICQIKTWKIG